MDIDLQDLMEIALGTRHEDPIDFEVDVLQPAPQSHFGTSSSTGMVSSTMCNPPDPTLTPAPLPAPGLAPVPAPARRKRRKAKVKALTASQKKSIIHALEKIDLEQLSSDVSSIVSLSLKRENCSTTLK